jgi:hypothetical protein
MAVKAKSKATRVPVTSTVWDAVKETQMAQPPQASAVVAKKSSGKQVTLLLAIGGEALDALDALLQQRIDAYFQQPAQPQVSITAEERARGLALAKSKGAAVSNAYLRGCYNKAKQRARIDARLTSTRVPSRTSLAAELLHNALTVKA